MASESGMVRTEQYGYDELSRLTSVDYGDGQTQTYTFDPMGNRTGKTDSVNGNDASTFNAANMLLTKNGQGYTYDANGNTLTGGGRTNSWDSASRLTQIVFNGTTTTHTYGSDGLRRRTVKGADTTDYILDGDSVIRTLQNGVLDRTYFHGLRGPEYERTGAGNPTWYVYDGLGSVVGLLDVNGSLVSTRKYDVYGSVRGGTGISGSKHKFVGGLGHPSEDDAGLIYMRARWMDPTTGTFASEDPARDGANWFGYCNNSPVGFTDRTGLAPHRQPDYGLSGGFGVSFDFGDVMSDMHIWKDRNQIGAIFNNSRWKHVYSQLSKCDAKALADLLDELGDPRKKGFARVIKRKYGLPGVAISAASLDASFSNDPVGTISILMDFSGNY